MGPAAGGAVYSPALTDFVFMVNHTSYMFVTGPNVVKEVLNEDVTSDGLGGAEVHARKSGVAHMIYDDEENTILALKKFLSYLPSNNVENPPVVADDGSISDINEKLRDIVPDDPNKAYDVKDVINQIVDRNSFFETAELFGAKSRYRICETKRKNYWCCGKSAKSTGRSTRYRFIGKRSKIHQILRCFQYSDTDI